MFDKDQKINRLTLKNAIVIITYTVLLILGALHYNDVWNVVRMVIGLLKPFIYGIMLAFLFNLPMKFFMRKIPDTCGKWKKSFAVLASLGCIAIVATFIIWIVLPQIIESISLLVSALPDYLNSLLNMIEKLIEDQIIPADFITQINEYSKQIQTFLVDLVRDGLPQIINMAGGFASSMANILMAMVIAMYLTVSKDKLILQSKLFIYAFTSTPIYDYLLKIARLSNQTFSNFVTGQMMEAIIIGILCYIGCLILRFPYAPILSVIIGCTNIIPIFGAIFGVAISALLVAFVNPIQGVIFVIFGICLQQFESNLIYPRVVGSTVGLSGLWVLFAITIGGGLFNFAGMLLGLPTFSVIYALLKEEMHRRTQKKLELEQVNKK